MINLASIQLNIFMDGGPLMMSLILIALILSLIFLVMGFLNLKKNSAKSKKMLKLVGYSSVLGLTFGFFGSFLGLISAFDAIERMGDVAPHILAAGLKIALLTSTFGLFVFIIARIGMIILKSLQKA